VGATLHWAADLSGELLQLPQNLCNRKFHPHFEMAPNALNISDIWHNLGSYDEGLVSLAGIMMFSMPLTAQMRANGAKAIAEEPVLMMTRVPAPDGESNGVIQPVIVHAMLGADGKISEIETLQHPSDRFVADAIEWARNLLPRTMPASQP
jgi:hypothetical protein